MKKVLADGITVEVTEKKYEEMEKSKDTLICVSNTGDDAKAWILGTEFDVLIVLSNVFLACMKKASKEAADAAFSHIVAGLAEDLKDRIGKRETEENNND